MNAREETKMDSGRRALLAQIMDELRVDRAAVARLYLDFGPEIAAVVRHDVRRISGRRLRDDDIEAMTCDACLMLASLADAWRPDGGALPWVWARHRITALVADYLGPVVDPLPPETELEPSRLVTIAHSADDGFMSPVLDELAVDDDRCALLREAMDAAMGPGEVEVFLRYRVQQQSGDPSPSDTVANELGLRAPAVRQVASRARRKLLEVIDANPAYASLTSIDLLRTPQAIRERAA
jgi:hypothetical protein